MTLVVRDALPLVLAIVVVGRDVLVLIAFPLLERRGIERIEVNLVGKWATGLLLFGLTCLAYSETSWAGADDADGIGIAFMIVGTVLSWIAAGMYARVARARLSSLRNGKADG